MSTFLFDGYLTSKIFIRQVLQIRCMLQAIVLKNLLYHNFFFR